MKATWGNKYTSQFTSPEDVKVAMRVWLLQFAGTNRDILHSAMTRLGAQLEWPPTVQQMKAEIKTLQREQAPIPTALPAPARSRSRRAAEELQRMKKVLGGSSS
jgi:hypothetical protein